MKEGKWNSRCLTNVFSYLLIFGNHDPLFLQGVYFKSIIMFDKKIFTKNTIIHNGRMYVWCYCKNIYRLFGTGCYC